MYEPTEPALSNARGLVAWARKQIDTDALFALADATSHNNHSTSEVRLMLEQSGTNESTLRQDMRMNPLAQEDYPKRISELGANLFKDLAVAYGVAALAVPYLKGCNHLGNLSSASVYISVSLFALLLSSTAFFVFGTTLMRRYRHVRLAYFLITLCTYALVASNGMAVILATDSSYYLPQGNGFFGRVVDSVVDRFAFVRTCSLP